MATLRRARNNAEERYGADVDEATARRAGPLGVGAVKLPRPHAGLAGARLVAKLELRRGYRLRTT